MEPVKYRGVAFEYGDEILILPPLSTRQMEEHAALLDQIGVKRDETMKTSREFISNVMIPLVHSALTRNYPSMKVDEVKDFVTNDLIGPLMSALLGNNPAPKVKVGEPFPAVLPGSQSAPVPSLKSTGPSSEPGLLDSLDGHGSTSLKM